MSKGGKIALGVVVGLLLLCLIASAVNVFLFAPMIH